MNAGSSAELDPRVPKALRTWFVIHFWADILFALPLFFAPVLFLTTFGWPQVDPLTTRLVACALFGIGIESLIGRNADAASFLAMLNLKVIWSATATVGIAWSMLTADPALPPIGWAFFATFAGFHVIWLRFRLRLGRALTPS